MSRMTKIAISEICKLLFFALLFLNCNGDLPENTGNKINAINPVIGNNKEEMRKMIKPIATHENGYFFTDTGTLYGLQGQGTITKIEKIEVINQDGDLVQLKDFFKVKEDLFFTVADNSENGNEFVYYKQDKNGAVTEIPDLPTKPTKSRVQIDKGGNFTIANFKYNTTLCSDVRNLKMQSGIERFLMVDGFSENESGLFFNVFEGRPGVRESGLYFWPVDKMSINMIMTSGVMWY